MSVGSQYTQLILPNYNIPYTGTQCERFVEQTTGQSGVWSTAVHPMPPKYPTGAWDQGYGGGNHPDELPPAGMRVPVYFELGSTPAGHVAIQLEDGRVASSTQAGTHPTAYIHPSLQDLINVYAKANGSCVYLGWSEWIGKKQVVTEGDDMIEDTDEAYNRWALTSKYIRSRVDKNNQLIPLSREEFRKSAVGKTWLQAIEILEDGDEGTLVTLQTGEDAQHGDWVGQIKSLQGVVVEKDEEIAKLEKEIAEGGAYRKVLTTGTDLYTKV